MAIAHPQPRRVLPKPNGKIPESLIYEIRDSGILPEGLPGCSRKLFDFGVEKVTWVLTDAQTVPIATRERIESADWSRDVHLMDGQSFSIGAYGAKRGIIVE